MLRHHLVHLGAVGFLHCVLILLKKTMYHLSIYLHCGSAVLTFYQACLNLLHEQILKPKQNRQLHYITVIVILKTYSYVVAVYIE